MTFRDVLLARLIARNEKENKFHDLIITSESLKSVLL